MNKIIYLIIAIVVIGGVIFQMTKSDENNDPNANKYDLGAESTDVGDTDTSSKTTDYNSSRSNRTTDNGTTNNVDDDCDSETEDCETSEVFDEDSDNDSVPTEDSNSAEARAASGYIKIDDVKGESRDN